MSEPVNFHSTRLATQDEEMTIERGGVDRLLE